eukprot:93307-Chlamydomonas_euryale.AAC.4
MQPRMMGVHDHARHASTLAVCPNAHKHVQGMPPAGPHLWSNRRGGAAALGARACAALSAWPDVSEHGAWGRGGGKVPRERLWFGERRRPYDVLRLSDLRKHILISFRLVYAGLRRGGHAYPAVTTLNPSAQTLTAQSLALPTQLTTPSSHVHVRQMPFRNERSETAADVSKDCFEISELREARHPSSERLP